MVSGTFTVNGKARSISGKLNGDEFSFTDGGSRYTGRVNSGRIDGSLKNNAGTKAWSATRQTKS